MLADVRLWRGGRPPCLQSTAHGLLRGSFCPITPSRPPLSFPASNHATFCPNQVLVPPSLYFFTAAGKSRAARIIATGDSPNFAIRSDNHPPPVGATRITGSPGKYAIFPHSFWFSTIGSVQPYALRNRAIAASRLFTPTTTFSTPETGAPCALAEVCTRHARGVSSSMMNGSTDPGVLEPTSALVHSIDIPSGRFRLPAAGTVTAIPAFFSRSTSCSRTFVPTAQAHVTASSPMNLAQSDPVVTPALIGAIDSM